MSDTERATLAHKATQLAAKLNEGARAETVQSSDFMVGYWRTVAEMAVEELQKVVGKR